MAKYFRDLSYICIILFIVLGWHIMDNIVSEKEVDITSLEVALRVIIEGSWKKSFVTIKEKIQIA